MEARPGKGPIPADYAFVGIAPSPNRPKNRDNEPFGASSWTVLQQLLQFTPGTAYVTNLVRTPVPPGKNPKKSELRRDQPILFDELKLVSPKRILAIGSAAAVALCPGFDSLREDHGTLFFQPDLNAIVVPTYHFSAVRRDPTRMPMAKRDIWRFLNLPDPAPPTYRVLSEVPRQFPQGSHLFLDIETTGLDPDREQILSIGLLLEGFRVPWILPSPTQEDLIALYRSIHENGVIVVGHHLQFDLEWLMAKSGRYWDVPVEDTMLMAHCLGETSLSLKHLTTTYTDRPGSRAFGGPNDYGYLAEDVLSTGELYTLFHQRQHTPPVRALLNHLLPGTCAMRRRGVFIDRELLQTRMIPEYEAKTKDLSDLLSNLAGENLNWNSTNQVKDFLLDQGVVLTERTKTGGFSVKESVLLGLADHHPVCKLLLEYRDAAKQLSFLHGYVEITSDAHPYLHPRLLLHGTKTGRLSCTDPNLQQVPRLGPVKLMFRSRWPGGSIGLIDLSQAELRVGALISGDRVFADALLSEDVHRTIASWVFHKPREEVTAIQRKKSKGITFGILYGGGPGGLAKKTNSDPEEVRTIFKEFFGKFEALKDWLDETKGRAIRDRVVDTPFGRIRDLSGLIQTEGEHSAQRKAVNTPIQSTASDVALCIMDYCIHQLREHEMKSRVLFGVHDSVVLEIHPGELNRVSTIVQEAFIALSATPLSSYDLWGYLPLVGELVVGDTWAAVESTSEFYDPTSLKIPCSSHPHLEQGGVISEKAAGEAEDLEDSTEEEEDEE